MELTFSYYVGEVGCIPIDYQPKGRWRKRPFVWIYRLLKWAIEKTSYERIRHTSPKYKTHTITDEKVRRLFSKAQHALERYHNTQCSHMLIGKKQIDELLNDVVTHGAYGMVDADNVYGFGSDTQFYGVNVIMVPWIDDAMIPLPEIEEMKLPRDSYTRRDIV